MIALIDTQVFIWMDTNSSRLSPAARSYFADPNCTILLSVVSVWEVVIKSAKGKLALSADIGQVVRDVLSRNPLKLLPVSLAHVLAVRNLPAIHSDPFDRLLAAQAIVEGAVLLSADPIFKQYPIQTDW